MNEDIKVLNEKIDFLTEQVMSVTSRLKAFDELKEDLALFANDAFREVIDFLADVDFHFRSEEFVLLIKKVLRNVKNISRMMDQLQSITELTEDVTPLAREMFNDIVEKFEQFEKDGLFISLQTFMNGMKRLHRNFTPEEIERMGDNHIRLIKLSNRLATSENMDKLESIVDVIEKMDFQKEKKVSLFKVLKKARSREVLQSLDMVLDIAAAMTKQNNKNNKNIQKIQEE
jgi:uncharacterized protein YjgD (DUF1641 family)